MKLITLIQVSDAEESDETNIAKLLTVSSGQVHEFRNTDTGVIVVLCHFADSVVYGCWWAEGESGCYSIGQRSQIITGRCIVHRLEGLTPMLYLYVLSNDAKQRKHRGGPGVHQGSN